jgi:hypothetical protein
MARKRILVISDLHCGSTVAPWPADQPLVDGGKHKPNQYQRFLNKCFHHMVKEAETLKPDTLVLLGDVVQGVNAKDSQLVTSKWSIQTQAAHRLLAPLTAMIPTVYQVRGTEWHEGRGSEQVEALAIALGAKSHPTTGSPTWRRLYLRTDAGLIDFMHHVSTTSIRQYSATAVLRDALNHRLEMNIKYGAGLPPLVGLVRAHAHIWACVQSDGITAVRCPAWQLGTAFTDARGNAMLSDIGWTLIEVGERGIGVTPQLYAQPKPVLEVA